MGKIKVLAILEVEEDFIADDSKTQYLKVENADISIGQDMVLSFPELQIDLYHREVTRNGTIIDLTDLEFRLLHYLASQPGRVFTYQQIFEAVWGEKYMDNNNTVMAHIGRLREKMKERAKNPKFIKTVWGVGYTIEK